MNPHSSERFERAYVALGYALNQRGAKLLARLALPCTSAKAMVRGLEQPERHQRARALAVGLAPIVEALDLRRLR